ncbi:RHS repeat protein [Flavobacterium sangjuense]|uniref:Uncharacterized protein n=1 Tax=Flavobacterium sangjuense TaxID=2518177 RepID=A0A4P7PWP7_9FLAO|nr:RHS repeat domain-containing protein [Flavobacterium sangjuense]QBZ98880.1 hypothetical protein GS03_02392 [Flavobacterium sangjuense]
MRKYITLVIVLFYKMTCLAQEMPKVIPPSPEAASVFKFSEVPVSLYTGLPNISIPLFEIESGGVKVPISLSYHARGIKVAEISSRVGLGWTLNAGGMISRQIRCQPDGEGYPAPPYNASFDFSKSLALRNYIWNSFTGREEDWVDFIPDQYFFNTGTGLSGKFIHDYADNQILPQNYSNVKVHSVGRITDDKGNEYFFEEGDSEIVNENLAMEQGAYASTNPTNPSSHINTWYLYQIKTPTGQEINFTYENENINYLRRSYDKYEHAYTIHNTGGGDVEIPGGYKSYSNRIQSYQKRIREISFDKGSVVFEYGTESRLDFGGKYLKNVTLYDNAGAIIQQKVLDYEYTNSDDIDSIANMNWNLMQMDQNAANRLFLKSVQTKYTDEHTLPPYQFEYDTNKLPSRHSNSVDAWGYYNGKQNGQFFPESYMNGGGRVVDTIKSGAGLLKKIIYPEGGSANFYYEPNRVFSKFPKSTVYMDSSSPLLKKEFTLSPLDHEFTDSIRNQPIYTLPSKIFRKAFTIRNTVISNFQYSSIMGDETCDSTHPNHCNFRVSIRKLEDDTPICNLFPTNDGQHHAMRRLSPGNYVLVVEPTHPATFNPVNVMETDENFFMVHLQWLEEVAGFDDPIFAGGKRIHKIEYQDTQGNTGLTKTYDYTDPDTGKSSGQLFGLANFLGIKEVVTTVGGQTFNLLQPHGNIPGAPLSTYQEASLGYGVVTEYIGEGNNTIGKSVYRYTMTPESGDYYTFPFHPPPDHEWLRGKELSVVHYRKNDDETYSPVKKTENKYLYGGETYDVGFGEESSPSCFYSLPYRKLWEENLNCDFGSGEPVELYCTHSGYKKNNKMFRLPLAAIYIDTDAHTSASWLMYKVYHLTGGTVDLWKTKTTDYSMNGNEIINTTDYHYRHDYNYNVSVATQSTSDENPIVTRYYYATDPEMENEPIVDSLKSKNMIDTPLTIKTYKNHIKLSENKTIYSNWGSSLFLPEIIQTSKGNADLENRVRYNRYDTSGNPLEVQMENGMLVSYIWGYNKTQPIAKIENATNAEIASVLGMDVTTADESNLSLIDNLRDTLPNAMITTLTYRPLIGVTTITDPKGYKTTYTYDNFGRLSSVMDHEGNTISENEYHYRNQN